MVKVLAAWDWDDRPAAVLTLPSRTRPQLVASLGEQIAAIGRLPYAGALEYAADPGADQLGAEGLRADQLGADQLGAGQVGASEGVAAGARGSGQHNSAQRLAAVWATLRVPEPVRAVVAGLEGPVLLVDDRIETGWTMTVAAKLVREAGAPAVLPFVLALGG